MLSPPFMSSFHSNERTWAPSLRNGNSGVRPCRKTTLWSPPAQELPHHSVPGQATKLPSWSIASISSTVRSQRAWVMLKSLCAKASASSPETSRPQLILRLGARYGKREGRVIHLDIPLTHQEIADMVGATRQTVSGTLSRLKKQGVLSIDMHRIDIESEELLSGLTHE